MFGVSVGALALSNKGIPPEPLGLFERDRGCFKKNLGPEIRRSLNRVVETTSASYGKLKIICG